jgi:hypothetical protein
VRFSQPCQNNSLKVDQGIYGFIKEYQRLSRIKNGEKNHGVTTWVAKEPNSMKIKKTKRQDSIPSLVERGFAIHQQLALLNDEFKQIKERLKEEAASRPAEHVPLLEKDSEGSQWIAVGKGCECRIVFPDAKVKTEFDPKESDFPTIRSLAGDHFNSLFRRVMLYRPTDRKTFRSQVNNLLAPKVAANLLELSTSPTEPKTAWKSRIAGKEQS